METLQPHKAAEAERFIYACYEEMGRSREEADARMAEIRRELEKTGTYVHTKEELEHGARMAWRNSNRCIGRLLWQTLDVFDARSITDEQEAAETLFRHIRYATNGGKVRSAITIFAPDTAERSMRIWNHQLTRYAGYATDRGIVGDPASLALTRICERLGWRGAGTPFDLLPVVLQMSGRPPVWFELPEGLVLEVPIEHPDIPGIAEMNVKWYAVPFISDMALEIGGVTYRAAPFNGWYMGTEIGARNLADANRYNLLPAVARLMGLNTSANASLWKDRALVELNVAVLHSYRKAGVTIVDHHTAAEQFMTFVKHEKESGREATGRWSWLIPPLSPSVTPIWHERIEDRMNTPNFLYQPKPY
ncbi:nitric oxide synthase oxygenase [Paenibacillus cisolokensis]|uniref:Nitric oxide synthase oxygenase n=1 Tax=Paenibacillus cisolokensis TaxID=1658519 RepID=A0ABQ4N3D5_9BACL|nr:MULTISPECIES: nitric oxide synthase oxygenase [Paenibacillus]ALS27681.1 nitric oxide synthase [Paenibacillus sp. 32O-W]GIQ62476.1 nitric oxide synthase oxygenase [Paenibacillus cisolokensis]